MIKTQTIFSNNIDEFNNYLNAMLDTIQDHEFFAYVIDIKYSAFCQKNGNNAYTAVIVYKNHV